MAGRTLPPQGVLLTSLPLVELLIAIAVLAVASMCLGLFVSAFVTTSEKAMPFLVMLTMVQVILSGGVLPLAGLAGLSQLSWLAPGPLGIRRRRPTVNLNAIGLTRGHEHRPTVAAHRRRTGCGTSASRQAWRLIFLLLAWIRLRCSARGAGT